MDNNYWKEYWDTYYKFMDFYLEQLKRVYNNEDYEEIEERYTEVAKLFEPSVRPNGYVPPFLQPGNQGPGPVILPFPPPPPGPVPGQGQGQGQQGQGQQGQGQGQQGQTPFISPGGGQFTINNCRRMAVVRVVMRGGFNPSNFYMLVESADRRSIQGYRIACNEGRIRFVAMSVEYRNINFIECVF